MTTVKRKVTLNGELMFPSDYVAAVELQGRDVTLTVKGISKEALQMKDGGNKSKLVMRFEKTAKKLVVNKTNADVIAGIYGTAAEKWVGKRVTLYPTRCLAFGEMVDCIRVREKVKSQGQEGELPEELRREPDLIADPANPPGG